MIFLAEEDGKHVWNKSKFKWKINSFWGKRKKKIHKKGELAKDGGVNLFCAPGGILTIPEMLEVWGGTRIMKSFLGL